MESLFWGRTDYQDLDFRKSYAGHMKNQWTEWVWQGSESLGKTAEVLAGELGGGGYGAPIGWDNDGGAIQDNPSRHDYNLDSIVDNFIKSALSQANFTKGKHQMWPCGSDFQYQVRLTTPFRRSMTAAARILNALSCRRTPIIGSTTWTRSSTT